MKPSPTSRPPMRRIAAVAAALVVVLAACGGSSGKDDAAATSVPATGAAAEATATLLGPDEFASYLEQNPEAPVVNVHIPYEGHIDGTDHFVPYDEIGDWDGLPADKHAPLVLYCMSGNMSATASDTLAAMGYTDIVDLAGGMQAWTSTGRKLLVEEPPPK